MDILHFTPGSLDPENVRRHGTVAHMPLASGQGELELSCLYLSPGGQIAVAPTDHTQLLLIVNGRAEAAFPNGMRLSPLAGMGLLLQAGDGCQLASRTGAVILTIEADQLAADPCGISHPERVMGQQWPSFESN
jgi:hypothetical protein